MEPSLNKLPIRLVNKSKPWSTRLGSKFSTTLWIPMMPTTLLFMSWPCPIIPLLSLMLPWLGLLLTLDILKLARDKRHLGLPTNTNPICNSPLPWAWCFSLLVKPHKPQPLSKWALLKLKLLELSLLHLNTFSTLTSKRRTYMKSCSS